MREILTRKINQWEMKNNSNVTKNEFKYDEQLITNDNHVTNDWEIKKKVMKK